MKDVPGLDRTVEREAPGVDGLVGVALGPEDGPPVGIPVDGDDPVGDVAGSAGRLEGDDVALPAECSTGTWRSIAMEPLGIAPVMEPPVIT